MTLDKTLRFVFAFRIEAGGLPALRGNLVVGTIAHGQRGFPRGIRASFHPRLLPAAIHRRRRRLRPTSRTVEDAQVAPVDVRGRYAVVTRGSRPWLTADAFAEPPPNGLAANGSCGAGIADEVVYDGIAVRVAGDLLAAGSCGSRGWAVARRHRSPTRGPGGSGRERRAASSRASFGSWTGPGRARPVCAAFRAGRSAGSGRGFGRGPRRRRWVLRGSKRGSRSPAAGGAARGVRRVEQLVDLFDYD